LALVIGIIINYPVYFSLPPKGARLTGPAGVGFCFLSLLFFSLYREKRLLSDSARLKVEKDACIVVELPGFSGRRRIAEGTRGKLEKEPCIYTTLPAGGYTVEEID